MTVMTASYMREYRQRRASRRAEAKGGLLPFQQSFVDAVCRVNHPQDVAALSCPRGSPIIAVDLGGSRSWSAACAIWPSGRITAWAIAPGSPSLADQEQADQVPTGTYAELARSGGLSVDTAHAVPDIGLLLAKVWSWKPNVVVCDPHRVAELHSCVGGRVRVVERARGGAETVSNIQALRSLLLDSTAGVTESSRDLLGAAFMQTNLVVDATGNTKITKSRSKRSRDDAAAALLLAAGESARRPAQAELRGAHISREGAVTWL